MTKEKASSPTDRPPESSSGDRLDRVRWVERLSDTLIDPITKRATGVVVAVTGPWGSGKTTSVGFLRQRLEKIYPSEALIFSFNPWLISGRDDLIRSFFNQLLSELRSRFSTHNNVSGLIEAISKYEKAIAPSLEAAIAAAGKFVPIIGGALAKVGISHLKTSLAKRGSLDGLRAQIIDALERANLPIVVIIDEIDRLDDGEVRLVAQLVRSIADFRGISYVLAYDQDRVMEALGNGNRERGRAYLEKIVQFPFALPILFSEELLSLFVEEIESLQPLPGLPSDWQHSDRFKELWALLNQHLLATPRDIKRLVGTFNVVERMVRGEVDWVDMIGLSALMTKAPMTVERIRLNIDSVVDDPASITEQMSRMIEATDEEDLRFGILNPKDIGEVSCRPVLRFLFPRFGEKGSRREATYRAISRRRNLCTVLRWGLIPGDISRAEVGELPFLSTSEIEGRIKKYLSANKLDLVLARAEEEFPDLVVSEWDIFWRAAARALKKPDCAWPVRYSPMHATLYALTHVFTALTERSANFRARAVYILDELESEDLIELPAHILRQYVFAYGMFGRSQSVSLASPILSEPQTHTRLQSLVSGLPSRHQKGAVIPCYWSLMPIYCLIDLGLWDAKCREDLFAQVVVPKALDGLTLMLFGGHYSTDSKTVETIIDREQYGSLLGERLKIAKSENVDVSVITALTKAYGEHP